MPNLKTETMVKNHSFEKGRLKKRKNKNRKKIPQTEQKL